jgi:hypothetical protein
MFGHYDYCDDRLATEAEADREYANYAGSVDRNRAWVLSDRDVWYANPYYRGPAVPHPEDEIYEAADLFFFNSRHAMALCHVMHDALMAPAYSADNDDEIPF